MYYYFYGMSVLMYDRELTVDRLETCYFELLFCFCLHKYFNKEYIYRKIN